MAQDSIRRECPAPAWQCWPDGSPGSLGPLASGDRKRIITLLPPEPHECPDNAEVAAEAYILGTLTAEQATAYEDHYLSCETCATVVFKTAHFFDQMNSAAQKVREDPEGSTPA